MRAQVSFAAVLEQLDATGTPEDSSALLATIRDRFGLANVVYFASHIPGLTRTEPLLAVTYPDAWVEHYKAEGFVDVDPVLPAGLKAPSPTDWSLFDRKSPALKRFFGEADSFGVGRQGLTLPIRGARGEIAMLSLTSMETPREWASFCRHFTREFQIVAAATHDMVLRVNGARTGPPHLAPRETECLKWASEGNTYEDIATILGITRGTVKTHMESARRKMHTLNTTHTVARAIRLGLI